MVSVQAQESENAKHLQHPGLVRREGSKCIAHPGCLFAETTCGTRVLTLPTAPVLASVPRARTEISSTTASTTRMKSCELPKRYPRRLAHWLRAIKGLHHQKNKKKKKKHRVPCKDVPSSSFAIEEEVHPEGIQAKNQLHEEDQVAEGRERLAARARALARSGPKFRRFELSRQARWCDRQSTPKWGEVLGKTKNPSAPKETGSGHGNRNLWIPLRQKKLGARGFFSGLRADSSTEPTRQPAKKEEKRTEENEASEADEAPRSRGSPRCWRCSTQLPSPR